MCGDCRGKCGDKRVALNIFFFIRSSITSKKRAASCLLVSVSPQSVGLQGFLGGDTGRSASALRLESQTSNPITLAT